MSDRVCSKCEQDAEFDFTFLHGKVICEKCKQEYQAMFEKAVGVFPYQNDRGDYCLTLEDIETIIAKVTPTEHAKYDSAARFDFPVDMDGEEVEEWLALAVIDAEMTFGHPRVGQEYTVSPESRSVEIDVSGEFGKHVAKIFGELVERAASAKSYLEMMKGRGERK